MDGRWKLESVQVAFSGGEERPLRNDVEFE
jgi:hypothetical protein